MPGTPAQVMPCFYIEEDGSGVFDHDWRYKSDFIGDAGVINGTMNVYYRECLRCGIEEEICGSEMPYDDDDDGFTY